MKRSLIAASGAILASVAFTACTSAGDYERACKSNGGVSSTDSYEQKVTCKDGTVHDV